MIHTIYARSARPALPMLLILLTLLVAASPAAAEEPPVPNVGADPEGLWVGALVMDPARFEVDLVVELERDPEAGWSGSLLQPVSGTGGPLQDVRVDGRDVAFVYRDETGASSFRGELSPDGERLAGKMKEGEQLYDFYFQRRQAMPEPSPLVDLVGDNRPLIDRFNADRGKVRLVVALSPTCGTCLYTARAVQRYLLEEVESDRLAVHLVWGPMLEADDADGAAAATVHMADPRVVHYWTGDEVLANELREVLPLESGAAWDVFLIYPPDARWQEGVPAPSSYLHQLKEQLPEEHRFDARELVRRVEGLLATE